MSSIDPPDISPVWGNDRANADGDMTKPADAFIKAAWLNNGIPPSRQIFNWVLKQAHRGVRHLMSYGIPAFVTAEDSYVRGSVVRGPDGVVYQLVGVYTGGTPDFGDLNWIPLVDTWGLNPSRTLLIEEDWTDIGLTAKTANNQPGSAWFGRWNFLTVGTGGAWSLTASGPNPDPSSYPNGPLVSLNNVGTTQDAATLVEAFQGVTRMSENQVVVMEQVFTINGASAPKSSTTFALGIADGSMSAAALDSAFGSGVVPAGCGICCLPGDTAWSAWSKPPGGSFHEVAIVSHALSRDTPLKLRVEMIAKNLSLDSKAHNKVYLDGDLIGDFYDGGTFAGTDFDMTASGGMGAFPFLRASTTASSGEQCTLNGGRLRFGAGI